LVTDALKTRARACEIDKAPGKDDRTCDQAPVMLALD